MSQKPLRYQEIFVPGGFPRHTYNPRVDLNLEANLESGKDNLCKLITVTGQTKSGKTVLTRKIFPNDKSVWIDGGAAATEEEFWQLIVEKLELFQEVTQENSEESSNELETKMTGEAGLFVVKGTGEIGGTLGSGRSESKSGSRSVSSKIAALSGLKIRELPLIIDDFHYLTKDIQAKVIRALKPLVFDGLPVTLIAIPHRRYDSVKVEREIAGRMVSVQVPVWQPNELQFIANKGFHLLGYDCPAVVVSELAEEAIGSPHLMQDFCRGICSKMKLEFVADAKSLEIPNDLTGKVFSDVADTIGRPIFDKLAKGPRARTDRKERTLKNGKKVDIYQLVLHALASIRPGLISLEYEDLRGAIREVSGAQVPQLHEVARVLKHMSTIASSDQSSTPVIDFEEDERRLHITDPFFAFYLRWGNLDT